MGSNRRRFWLYFFPILIVDQLTKTVLANGGVANTVINQGISFNWLAVQIKQEVITVLTIAVAVLIAVLFRQIWRQHPALSGIFWGGAISNILDRLLIGGVVDWITIPMVDITNNLADIAISIGVIGLVIATMKEKHDV